MSDQEKEVTIYDIANKLNISAATVSRGLKDHPGINKNTKKKIILEIKNWITKMSFSDINIEFI